MPWVPKTDVYHQDVYTTDVVTETNDYVVGAPGLGFGSGGFHHASPTVVTTHSAPMIPAAPIAHHVELEVDTTPTVHTTTSYTHNPGYRRTTATSGAAPGSKGGVIAAVVIIVLVLIVGGALGLYFTVCKTSVSTSYTPSNTTHTTLRTTTRTSPPPASFHVRPTGSTVYSTTSPSVRTTSISTPPSGGLAVRTQDSSIAGQTHQRTSTAVPAGLVYVDDPSVAFVTEHHVAPPVHNINHTERHNTRFLGGGGRRHRLTMRM